MSDHDDDGPEFDDGDNEHPNHGRLPDGSRFADPGGRSALRASSNSNPRNLPCLNCGEPNRLTPADKAQGYQCNTCADASEGYGP